MCAARGNSNRVVAFLLQKLENNQDKNRLSTLEIIKHLINSCGELQNGFTDLFHRHVLCCHD